MSEAYLGEIRITGFNFPPVGWAFCNGQLLPISQYQALFSLLGTTYGGDGRTNFALPNLQGRAPTHQGAGIVLGQAAGSASVALTAAQVPAHVHALQASTDFANSVAPTGNVLAAKPRGGINAYAPAGSPLGALHPAAVATSGGGQPHDNMQPYLTLNFIIALAGIFPSQG